MRALRADKITFAMLEATLAEYAAGRAADDHSGAADAARCPPTTSKRARRRSPTRSPRSGWRVAMISGSSAVGGGSAPGLQLPTVLLVDREGRRIAGCDRALAALARSAGDRPHRARSRRPRSADRAARARRRRSPACCGRADERRTRRHGRSPPEHRRAFPREPDRRADLGQPQHVLVDRDHPARVRRLGCCSSMPRTGGPRSSVRRVGAAIVVATGLFQKLPGRAHWLPCMAKVRLLIAVVTSAFAATHARPRLRLRRRRPRRHHPDRPLHCHRQPRPAAASTSLIVIALVPVMFAGLAADLRQDRHRRVRAAGRRRRARCSAGCSKRRTAAPSRSSSSCTATRAPTR